MATKKNIAAAKKLVKRYNSITIEEIKFNWVCCGKHATNKLSGFGRKNTCNLCVSVNDDCDKCIYSEDSCSSGINKDTYYAIAYAASPDELLTALRNRAEHIQKILEKLESK